MSSYFTVKSIKNTIRKLQNLRTRDLLHLLKHSRQTLLYGFALGFTIMLLIPVFTYAYFVRDLSSKENIINKKNAGVVLLDRNENPFFTLFDAHTKNPVALAELPEYTQQAFIAVEDKDFYNHPGFSLRGFARAVRENISSESFAQGGSTISQQLIKNAILSADKRLLRKYQEIVLALELERRYSKEDILEMYLNTIYFGEGSFGIQDASQKYFSKGAQDLTLAESALLAGLIQAPSAYSPISGDKDAAIERRNLVLELMAEQGYISQSEKNQAQTSDLTIQPSSNNINSEAVHFALMVQDILIEEYGEQTIAQSGYQVKTTLDLDLQTKAQQAVEMQVQRLSTSDVSNGAAVAIDPNTGELLALVGSHNWNDEDNGKINMALRPRQPGSSFKPLVYAKALEERIITPSTQIADEPVKFGNYEPKNYDNKFRGKVLVRYALANSLNIPAIHVLDKIGISRAIDFAESLGITTLKEDTDYGLSLVLGAAEVPLIEMTNAFATFANEGMWTEYSPLLEVRDKKGNVILENSPVSRQVVPGSIAFLISSILSDNKARSDVFGNSLTISRPAAVKTGTTNDYKDALTIGYTPQITVGVWIGNNDNTPMSSVAGSMGAAPIWRQIMEAYLQNKPVENFKKPVGVEDEQVCFEDGLKVEYATASAYTEYFLRGTKPTKLCGLPSPTPSGSPTPTPGEENKPTDSPTPTPTNEPTPTTQPTDTPTATPLPSPFSPTQILPTFGFQDDKDKKNE